MDNIPIIDSIQGKAPSELPVELSELLSYDKLNDRWFIEYDNNEYSYNSILERWIPSEPTNKDKKRSSADEDEGIEQDSRDEILRLKKQKLQELKEEKNSNKLKREISSLYVSDLPLDITSEELETFFQKFGVISDDLTSSHGAKRIKMYTNKHGSFKGDALITYLRPESCKLAIELAGHTKLRHSDAKEISVTLADFSHSSNNTEKDDKEKPKMKIDFKDKAVQKRIKKMNRKLEDWEDEGSNTVHSKSNADDEKTVVIKNCFTLQELKDDPTAQLDIKEDIREGCEEIGEVTNVVLYDLEPQGIVVVRFSSSAAATLCVSTMNGRYFGGQKLEVSKFDGVSKYAKTKKNDHAEGSAEREQERLEKFSEWIES